VITRDKNNTQLIIIIKQIHIYPNLSISICEREKCYHLDFGIAAAYMKSAIIDAFLASLLTKD
jgi:hypothetical protein